MRSPSSSLRRARPLLGTIVEIAATGWEATLPSAVDAAFSAIEDVQRLMSFHDERSNVSRINAALDGEEVHVHAHTWRVLTHALKLSELSHGAFDVTTAAALVRYGFLPHHGNHDESAPHVTWRDLELLDHYRVKWRRKGCIDLGGIAKGYAVDCAIEVLRASGVTSGAVNAGGDLRCFGEPQLIHVRQTTRPTELLWLGWLADGAIATSGGYFAGMRAQGEQIDPLVDPKCQSCVTWDASISALATDCMTADALTKIVRLAPALAPGLLAELDAQAIVIDEARMSSCGRQRLQMESRNEQET